MQSAALKLEKTRIADYWDLTKPGITFLVVITAAAAFYLASSGYPDYLLLVHAVLGIACISGGGGALNHYIERERDAMMNRTKNRPIPSGRVHPMEALLLGTFLSIFGIAYLFIAVNSTTALLGALTLIGYVAVYTPLKRISAHSTVIGAFPGAMPPVLGWTAAQGSLSIEALVLFGIVFFWQMPHFLGIAWMYRKDYERGGFRILPVVEPDGKSTSRMILIYCTGLLPVSLLPTVMDLAGYVYFVIALAAGLAFLYFSVRVALQPTNTNAKYLVLASVLHLPLVMAFIMIDAVRIPV
jgi:heme o synthase